MLRNMAATHAEAAASKHLNFTVTIDPAMPETLALDAHYLQDIVDCLVGMEWPSAMPTPRCPPGS